MPQTWTHVITHTNPAQRPAAGSLVYVGRSGEARRVLQLGSWVQGEACAVLSPAIDPTGLDADEWEASVAVFLADYVPLDNHWEQAALADA